MFGWIDRIWHWGITNVGDPVASWVRDFVRGVFGWLDTLFGHIGNAWSDLAGAAYWLRRAIDSFGHDVFDTLGRLFYITIPRLIRWAGRELTRLGRDILAVYHRLVRDVISLIKRIEAAIRHVINWAIIHIWRPLKKDFLTAWHWITHFGRILWFYITHPDKLVALIFTALLAQLERDAWKIGRLLGKFFLGLIVHNLKMFVIVIEDILMAVF